MRYFITNMAVVLICNAFLTLAYSDAYSSSKDSILIVNSIQISGNKITNEKVILREIPFRLSDTLITKDLSLLKKKIRENLDNIQLFNFTYIEYQTDSIFINWNIAVEERWYIWPIPIIEYADRNLSSFLKQGDYSRINYGAYITVDNFRGMRDQLTLRLVLGYRKQMALRHTTYSLDKEKRHGLKSWISYVSNHEVPYTNIDNKQVFYKSPDGKVRSIFNLEFAYQYRPAIHWYHTLTLGHQQTSVIDTIVNLNPNYFGNDKTNHSLTELRYDVFLEKRNQKVFPLSGYYLNFNVSKMGILPNDFASYWKASLSGGFYSPIASKFFVGTDFMVKGSSKTDLPYFLNDAIGYKNYIRGYEHYVTNGSQYFINKNSFKFQLIPPKVVILPFIPEEKFSKTHIALYWSLFVDTGMIKSDTSIPTGSLEGRFLYGYGTGIYMVAYYDIVLRVEYSFNILGEGGFFVHFGTPFLNY